MASDLDAVCRSEAQRVTTALRANRRWSQNRSWGHEEASPLRQLCTWRLGSGGATELLEPHQPGFCFWKRGRACQPLLRILRSAEFGGPATFVALEAAHNVVVAVCEEHRSGTGELQRPLAGTLCDVARAACECVFEETNAQTDEATAAQMVALLSLCCSAPLPTDSCAAVAEADSSALFSPQDRVRAFSKVLAVWSHYRQSHMLRASAQAALQRILDACLVDLASPARCDFLRLVLGNMAAEAEWATHSAETA
ncbi:BIG2 [Symbiodinium microadriaticum]|nr:BIG2 [Symbiodinium microadriaticum]